MADTDPINLIIDGDFEDADLHTGAPGVVSVPDANYTLTPPPFWSGTGSMGSMFPTATASTVFYGQQVAFLNYGATLSQNFSTLALPQFAYAASDLGEDVDQYQVSLQVASRSEPATYVTSGVFTVGVWAGSTALMVRNYSYQDLIGTENGTQPDTITFDVPDLSGPNNFAGQTLTLTITNNVNPEILVDNVVVQPIYNLVADGDFSQQSLADGAPGVVTDPVHGNYTGTAPPGWTFTQGSGGLFAPIPSVSPGFAGSGVAYLNGNSTLAQTFLAPAVVGGHDQLVVTLDVGTRNDIPPSTGGVTASVWYGSQEIGEATFNLAAATPGQATQLQFTTSDPAAEFGLIGPTDGGRGVTLKVANGSNSQLLVDNVHVAAVAPNPPGVFNVNSEAALNNAIRAIDVGGTSSAAGAHYLINITGSISLTSPLLAINLAAGSSLIVDGTTNGGAAAVQTIDGNHAQRGFFVYSGTVEFENLQINNAKAVGGAGGSQGGGGGAGLGGGLFVAGPTQGAAGGNVVLRNVSFSGDSATGGAGGNVTLFHPYRGAQETYGGGGGLGGAGGSPVNGGLAGGGGIGLGAVGATPRGAAAGAGIIPGAAGGGVGVYSGNAGTGGFAALPGAGSGGGGGAGGLMLNFALPGPGGGVGGKAWDISRPLNTVNALTGGAGGFGGGGGAGNNIGGTGGFGGGGGAAGGHSDGHGHQSPGGGRGGFGGGGGGGAISGGAGGFGGGHGNTPHPRTGIFTNGGGEGFASSTTAGGGGLGAGGDIFVMQGATLTIEGGGLAAGTVQGGASAHTINATTDANATAGSAFGSGLFIQGNQSVTLSPLSGQTLTLAGVIADMHGSIASYSEQGSLVISGPGTVALTAANTYQGGTIVKAGTLSISTASNIGGGTLTLDAGATLDLTGSTWLWQGIDLAGDPTISVAAGQTLSTSGGISGIGPLVLDGGGTLKLYAPNTYSGGTTIQDESTLELGTTGAAAGSGPITFSGSANTLRIDVTTMPSNTIDGLGADDVIDLAGVGYSSTITGTIAAGNKLKITKGATTYTLQLDPNANYTGDNVHLLNDGSGGTDVLISSNLLADGDFGAVELLSGAPGVTAEPVKGNFTSTAPLGWNGSNLGAFAPTATASPGFAGSQVVYVNPSATLSQTFTTSANAGSGYEFVVSVNLGSRLDGGAASGSATVTLSAGGVEIGQGTFSAGTLGTAQQLSFVTGNIAPISLANQNITLSINNGTTQQLLVDNAVVQARTNLLTDGNFSAVNLASGAPGVTTEPTYGNYTTAAPTGWSGGGGFGVGVEAVTANASTFFAGTQAAYLNQGGALSQTFTAPNISSGPNLLMVSLDIGTRLNGPRPVGTVTVSATVNGVTVGQTTFNATAATPPGGGTLLQFTTQDLAALGDNGKQVTLAISNAASGQVLIDNVVVQPALSFNLASGHSATATTLISSPGIVLTGGGRLDLDNAGNSYSGGSIIEGQSTLEIGSAGAAGSGAITFIGTGDTLKIDGTTMPTNTIVGMVQGETIDLAGIAYSNIATANLLAGNMLQISENGQTYNLQLDPTANFAGDYFHLASDNSGLFGGLGGTAITENQTACYCRGTLIRMPEGERPVEALKIGDRVMTLSGDAKPVKWIGRRGYSGRFVMGNRDVLPIIVKKGALDDGVPARDLWVSPEHALYLDEALVPARHLVNDVSIIQAETVENVEYFHIELDAHDVIFAEGAPAESFVDDDSRMMFNNAPEFFALYPAAARVPARYCAPRIEDGVELERLRRRLVGRAGRLCADGSASRPTTEGWIDLVNHELIKGWVFDRSAPDRAVTVVVLDNGAEIARVTADCYRADLRASGIGDGCHGFSYAVSGGLATDAPHQISVYSEADWTPLAGSPVMLAPASAASRPEPGPAPGTTDLGELEGSLDEVSHTRIDGWVRSVGTGERPVGLVVTANGRVIARLLANRYRADLDAAGVGNGRHAFELVLAAPLSVLETQEISVKREVDGAELPGSPVVLPAASSFDAAAVASLTALFARLGAGDDEERALAFLTRAGNIVRSRRAGRESARTEREAQRLRQRRYGDAADRPARRALVIDNAVPQASRDAGSVAIRSHMRGLQALGFEVSFTAHELTSETEAVALATDGIAVCGAPYYSCVEDVLARQAGTFDLVYLHRLANADRYLSLARGYNPQARIVYSIADLHHLRFQRQARVEGRPELLALSRVTAASEVLAARRADLVLTHSPVEAELLRREVGPGKVHVVPFAVQSRAVRRPFAERRGIAFVGSFGHAPNPDAVHHLIHDILPLVWREDPTIACTIAGHGWAPDWLPHIDPRVTIAGAVDDLDALLDSVRLTVAPLRFGAGIKGKILDSFAAGLPCVMTPIAAEGLPLPPALQPLVGSDPTELAQLILRYHADQGANETASAAARFTAGEFTEDCVTKALDAALTPQPRILAGQLTV